MSEDIQIKTRIHEEIVGIANAMLNGQIHLLEGVRRICDLGAQTDIANNPIFMQFQAIDSETDHIPMGQIRERCAAEYLRRSDQETINYLKEAKGTILQASLKIIETLNSNDSA